MSQNQKQLIIYMPKESTHFFLLLSVFGMWYSKIYGGALYMAHLYIIFLFWKPQKSQILITWCLNL